jgi:hypothetical protein
MSLLLGGLGADRAPGIVRLALATVVCGTSLYFLHERYSCMLPSDAAFILLVLLFAGGVVLGVGEVVHALLERRASGAAAFFSALVLGVLAYAVAGGIVWLINPAPAHDFGDGDRALLSVFWGAGVLSEAAAYSDYPCGY